VLKAKARTITFFKQLSVRVKRGKRDALYSVCGLIRRDAIDRLKIRPGPSRPPASPHAHSKAGLRVIDFHVSGNTGIVGPRKFPNSNRYNKPVPAIHEFGGQVMSLRGAFRLVLYPKRPYMSKTVEKLKTKIPREFSIQLGRVL
jgi:hypothetical protein